MAHKAVPWNLEAITLFTPSGQRQIVAHTLRQRGGESERLKALL